MSGPRTVVKVGGSLFGWPEFGPRLRRWLSTLNEREVVLLPGGGRAADVIRDLDLVHELGEEKAHWLALRSLSLNAHVLAALLPSGEVVDDLGASARSWAAGRVLILDAHAFAAADEGQLGCLPHLWDVTSDSIAARVAVVAGARCLILLKSVTIPEGVAWDEAGRRGWVDPAFAGVLCQAPGLQVCAINLREWSV